MAALRNAAALRAAPQFLNESNEPTTAEIVETGERCRWCHQEIAYLRVARTWQHIPRGSEAYGSYACDSSLCKQKTNFWDELFLYRPLRVAAPKNWRKASKTAEIIVEEAAQRYREKSL